MDQKVDNNFNILKVFNRKCVLYDTCLLKIYLKRDNNLIKVLIIDAQKIALKYVQKLSYTLAHAGYSAQATDHNLTKFSITSNMTRKTEEFDNRFRNHRCE